MKDELSLRNLPSYCAYIHVMYAYSCFVREMRVFLAVEVNGGKKDFFFNKLKKELGPIQEHLKHCSFQMYGFLGISVSIFVALPQVEFSSSVSLYFCSFCLLLALFTLSFSCFWEHALNWMRQWLVCIVLSGLIPWLLPKQLYQQVCGTSEGQDGDEVEQ